ncbi:unnamed protein product [Trypanosoma congolense IL3000]|uniref:Hexosyltransferase n=1 Tax=Trypanosoma congolense (strain IL3000) TaxID=1068625 RepID=F9WG47_TRYCI|nr:unnamed protein product [Trypanosoma congolense IL3000]
MERRMTRARSRKPVVGLVTIAFCFCFLVHFLSTSQVSTGSVTSLEHAASPRPSGVVTRAPPAELTRNYPDWMREALAFTPAAAIRKWQHIDYLLVLGIPSVDMLERQRRRNLQRTTCWQYDGVARRANGFTGAMLPLYVLARHPSNGYAYTDAMRREVLRWSDMIALPMYEGKPSTNKKVGGGGKWGTEAEIGMSRKTFYWFDFALRMFPNASYFAKGDDDMFLRVPQYLADLRSLPRRGLYWGTMGHLAVDGYRFTYAFGALYTLGRDVAERFVSYRPLRTFINVPYSGIRWEEFNAVYLYAEDAMVGITLKRAGYSSELFHVNEKKCSFHELHAGFLVRPVSPSSVMVHHVKEEDYGALMKRFNDGKVVAPRKLEDTNRDAGVKTFGCIEAGTAAGGRGSV